MTISIVVYTNDACKKIPRVHACNISGQSNLHKSQIQDAYGYDCEQSNLICSEMNDVAANLNV